MQLTIQPHNFFISASIFFGLLMVIVTPPFQVADEVNHFYRAYQIADGGLSAESSYQRLGGHVPKSLVAVAEPFLGLRWNMNAKTSYETISGQLSIKLNEEDRVFVDFPNTALYSPISYLPQASAIFILKNLNLRPLIIFYGARVLTLFCWIICICYAIKIIPVFKWLFTLLALLPMSLFVNMSLSADVVTNIIAFLFFAFILKMTYREASFKRGDFFLLCFLAVLLASAKVVYIPLVFLFGLIPFNRFDRVRSFYGYFVALLLVGFATAYFWSKTINSIYIPFDVYNAAFRSNLDLVYCANIGDQMAYILEHGFYIIRVFINSLVQTFDMYYRGYIGTFGWLDAKLPEWVVHLGYLSILCVAVFDNNGKGYFSKWQKLILFVTLTAIVCTLLLSQHLTWDCVGAEIIATIQGRYFIPVFPLLFMLCNGVFNLGQANMKYVVIVFSILLLGLSSLVIYKRYFVYPVYESLEIKSGAELINDDKYIETSAPGVLLENADRRTNEAFRSGQYSIKLSAESPYGFTYRYYQGQVGDVIKVEVWRLGDDGSIVISGDSGRKFYVGTNQAVSTDEMHWNKLSFSYTVESGMHGKEIGIYLFNKNEPSYFDDLKITILKRQSVLGL